MSPELRVFYGGILGLSVGGSGKKSRNDSNVLRLMSRKYWNADILRILFVCVHFLCPLANIY